MTQTSRNLIDQPGWAETIRQKYLAGEASVFVLYRNVFDRYLVGGKAYGMTEFLTQILLGTNKQRIIEFSVDRGVRYLQGGTTDERETLYAHLEDKGLAGIFDSLERRLREVRSNALLIPYAGAIFPAAESHFLSMDERAALAAMHRWSLDDSLSAGDNVVLLITESLAEINPALLSNPRVAAVEVPMPDRAERNIAIRHYAPKMSLEQAARLADHTAGLRAIQIASIVAGEGPGPACGRHMATRCAVAPSPGGPLLGLAGSGGGGGVGDGPCQFGDREPEQSLAWVLLPTQTSGWCVPGSAAVLSEPPPFRSQRAPGTRGQESGGVAQRLFPSALGGTVGLYQRFERN